MSSHQDHGRKPDPARYRLPATGRSQPGRNASPTPPHHQQASHQGDNSKAMGTCLKHCQDCAGVCLRTITHCLALGGPHAAPAHQATLHDCADICETVARFLARESIQSRNLFRLCADICTHCATECDALPGDDSMMHECSQACRLCAESCLDAVRA